MYVTLDKADVYEHCSEHMDSVKRFNFLTKYETLI